jgi:signal transduction histidine kinase/HD-like signal output (HDOD) protein
MNQIDAFDSTRSRRVELILSQIETLPTLSPIATRLLELSSDDESDINEIVGLIESDPSLTAKILGLCRRADMGLGDRITTVKHAVLMLGLSAVQAAVLSVDVFELLQSEETLDGEARAYAQDHDSEGLDRVGFWKHAVAVACAAELLAEASPRLGVSPEEAFVSGLLHDLGKIVLDSVMPRSYARVWDLCERRRRPTAEIERAIIGIDHHTAGKRLAEHWALPHALQDVLWLHSQPMAGIPNFPHRNIIGVVSAAKAMCRSVMLGWSGEFGPPPDVSALCKDAGIDPDLVEQVMPQLHERVAKRCAALGIDHQADSDLLLQSVVSANRKLGRMYAMLSTRSKADKQQTRVLEAITTFHRNWSPGRSIADACEDVAKSACSVFGEGYYGVLFRAREKEPWQLCRFQRDGSRRGASLIERSWDPFGDPAHDATEAPGIAAIDLPWLIDHIADAPEPQDVRVLLMSTHESGPVSVLLHDRPLKPPHIGQRELESLTATWASAILAAAQHDGARRLGEQLAHTNRTLADMQAQWAEAQSMVRLGEMAAGAAHEMNNPLTVISGRSQMLAQLLENPRDQAAAASIAQAAHDLTNLISGLRLLADPPTLAITQVDVEDLLHGAASTAAQRTGSEGRVTIENDPGVQIIRCDADLLANALAELIVNAIESGPGVSVRLAAQLRPTGVRFVVTDTGPGFTDRAIQHAFDPFFSDKPAGRQTGLGLSRARRLVELHSGSIAIVNLSQGARVTLELPEQGEAQHVPSSPRQPGDDSRAA